MMTQADLFKNYADSNNLYLIWIDFMHWFEYGGGRIGRKAVKSPKDEEDENKWKLCAKYKKNFASHQTIVISEKHGFFILGGSGSNCIQFKDDQLKHKESMPEKSFFSAVMLKDKIYTFGGYDNYEKVQLKTCEVYDIQNDSWESVDQVQLHKARS